MAESTFRTQRFEILDGMRGVAALFVVLYHYTLTHHFKFLNNAYLAVDVFFVLSGFVVSHAYEAKLKSDMSAREYIARRFGRLFPLAAFGTILGAMALFLMSGVGLSNMSTIEIASAVLKNLFFIPEFGSKFISDSGAQASGLIFPGNSPMWSIFFELVASLLFLGLVRLSNVQMLIIAMLSFFGVLFLPRYLGFLYTHQVVRVDAGWNDQSFVSGFPRVIYSFSIGMFIQRMRRNSWLAEMARKCPAMVNPIWPFILLICGLAFPWTVKGVYGLFMMTILSPLIIFLGDKAVLQNDRIRHAMTLLGWISFPIYCVHEPILLIGQTLFPQGLGDLTTIGVTAVIALVVAANAALLHDRFDIQRKLTIMLLQKGNGAATYPGKQQSPDPFL